jgi:toxin ParE1/3/4
VGDLRAIRDYTRDRWGEKKAERYLDDAEAALVRLSRHPGLLLSREGFHPALRFYVMNKHIFVCNVSKRRIIVLTVLASRMDVGGRLARLEPTLATEVELLIRQLNQDT